MGYYDIDDVLADSIEVPCKFMHDIPGLGYLENNPGHPILENSKLKLPLWLARVLAIVGSETQSDENGPSIEGEILPFLVLMPPEVFSKKVINAIKSDPVALDLHSINPYFYALAIKWISLFSDKELSEIVSELLLERAQQINSHASSVYVNNSNSNDFAHVSKNTANNTMNRFTLTLDEFEKNIYKQAHDSYKDIKRWIYHSS